MAIKKNLPVDDYLGIQLPDGPQDTATPQGRAADDYLGIGAVGGQRNTPASQTRQASDYLGLQTLDGTGTGIAVDPATNTTASTGGGTGGAGKFTATDGRVFADELAFATYQASLNTQTTAAAAAAAAAAKAAAATATAKAEADEEKRRKGQSAFDFLNLQFTELGIGDLITPLKDLIIEGISSDEMTLRLMNDPKYNKAYKTRFSANDARRDAGLRVLSPAEYVGLEDQYQDVMRQYGLPESYYAKDATGKQIGFEKLIANNVSNLELADRIGTAQKRVLNANPEVTQALKQFYPDITNADILAYTLDPKNAIETIKRKVTAAEIGGAALQSGLGYKGATPEATRARAEQLQAAGVTKESAQQGFEVIAGGQPRGSQLASIYGKDPYTQEVAETEVFGLAGKTDAIKKRQKITGLEKATFGGQSGITSGALARDRAGGY